MVTLKTNWIKILFSTWIFSLCVFHGSQSYAKHDRKHDNDSCYSAPEVKEVKAVVEQILVELEKNKDKIGSGTGSAVVYKIIDDLLVPRADFKIMSSLVLTRNWKNLDAQQQQSFIKEFSRLIIRTYGVAFESYDGETVVFHCPVRKLSGDSRVEVSSTIHHLKKPENIVKFRLIKFHSPKKVDDCEECITLRKKCVTISHNCKEGDKQCKSEYDQCKDKFQSCKQECLATKKKDSQEDKDEAKSKSKSKSKATESSKDKNNDNSNSNAEWKVYDLIIDNVSIIDSYRQVFSDKMRREKDVNKIISDMHQKNCEKNKDFCK